MEGRGEEKEIKDNILYWDCLRQQGWKGGGDLENESEFGRGNIDEEIN